MARTHGTISSYNRGLCRCPECRRAARLHRRRYRSASTRYALQQCPLCGDTFGQLGPHTRVCEQEYGL